jgi:hypothetical protein
MRSISPGLQKVSDMIAAKTGDKEIGSKRKPDLEIGKKKKKHFNFNFMKKK